MLVSLQNGGLNQTTFLFLFFPRLLYIYIYIYIYIYKLLFFFTPGVENIEFHCAKVEDVTEQIKMWAKNDKAVAIVDPPRPGLR